MRTRKTRQWMFQCFLAEQKVNHFIGYLTVDTRVGYNTMIRRMRAQLHNWNVEWFFRQTPRFRRICTHIRINNSYRGLAKGKNQQSFK
jgi:hypothetical protein